MLRILIVATVLVLVPATSVLAGSPAAPEQGATVHLRFGAQIGGAQAFVQPAIRASLPTSALRRSIDRAVRARAASERRQPPATLFGLGGGKSGLMLPVSQSVSLGLRYQYLRPEDLHLDIAETASLDENYSSHSLVMRARWKF